MNTESLNILKGIVDSDKLQQVKTVTQENLALNTKNSSLAVSNKNLKNALYFALTFGAVIGGYYLYQKHNSHDKQ